MAVRSFMQETQASCSAAVSIAPWHLEAAPGCKHLPRPRAEGQAASQFSQLIHSVYQSFQHLQCWPSLSKRAWQSSFGPFCSE